MVVDRLFRVLAHVRKHLQDKVLHVQDRVRVAGKLRIVPADVRVRVLDLLRQQVRLVEEQDDRDAGEGRVVDDRVEDVARLFEAVCFSTKREFYLILSKYSRVAQDPTYPPPGPGQTRTSTRGTESTSRNSRSIWSTFAAAFAGRRRRRTRMECSAERRHNKSASYDEY